MWTLQNGWVTLYLAALLISTKVTWGQQRTCTGSGETCVVLSSCPPLLKLLEPPVDFDNLRKLQESTCDEAGAEPKVCCVIKREEGKSQGGDKGSSTLDRILNHKNLHLLPTSTSCGKSDPVELTPDRVAGGTDAGLGTYPWMVLVGYTMTSSSKPGPIQYGCGGTLINSNYVLTAAHCVSGLPAGFLPTIIRVGEYNQTADVDCAENVCAPKAQNIPIAETIAHESYDVTEKKENDIAIIRMKKHVALGPFVAPICLPHGERLQKVSVRPWVAGWGRTTADNPDQTAVLQHVSVPFQSMEKCNELYGAALGNEVDDGRFCAGGEKGKDSCKGDSGGPLMLALKAKSANWALRVFQFGVVSLGPKDCDTSAFPALYTKVSHFMPWLLDHLKP
ncbi:CLIP domain-containing serine protease 2 isoform X2 [Folsomia candida]|uniref:CLIP domain-containing serine protease 2 isoform X2 n=1 Tax=Folsomia candida TaxID=158441 RepID=UPI000B8FBB9C|nr:CLIP domain-containing serine protease 2 isoform X2 [Folsomia candida]